jgi:hypothetical protein
MTIVFLKQKAGDRRHDGLRARTTLIFGVFAMSLGTILLIVLVLFLVGALPTWPHSSSWGYYPSGGLGIVLIIVVVLLLTGRL